VLHHTSKSNSTRQAPSQEIHLKQKSNRLTREDIRRCYSPGQWFMFPKTFLLILPAADAINLSYLINHEDKINSNRESKGLKPRQWFYCLARQFWRDLYYSPVGASKAIARLKKLGYVETKNGSTPTKTFVRNLRINYFKIRKDIDRKYDE